MRDFTFISRGKLVSSFKEYERYLPTAFDDSLSLLEKINKLIKQMNENSLITDELIKNWNEFVEWIMNEGLQDAVNKKLEEWLKDGTLADIITDILFSKRTPLLTINISEKYTDKTFVSKDKYKFKSLKNAIDFVKNMTKLPFKVSIISDDDEYHWEDQLIFEHEDFSFITIEGKFKINVSKFKECYSIPSSPSNYEFIPAMYGKMSKLPTLLGTYRQITATSKDPLFDPDKCLQCKTNGDQFGFLLLDNSAITLKTNNVEIKDFISFGIVGANGSQITAQGVKIKHIGNIDDLTPENADTLGKGNGVLLLQSGFAGNGAEITYCGLAGLNCSQSSNADIDGANISYCGHHNILTTSGSTASFKNGVANYCMDDSLVAYADSHIDAREATVKGNDVSKNYGIIATRNSTINFSKATTTGCEYGVMANRGSTVDCTSSSITTRVSLSSTASDAVRSANGSCVILSKAEVKHYGYGDVATAEHGSTLVCNEAILTAVNNPKTVVLAYAGIVYGSGAKLTGGRSNTILATRGGQANLTNAVIEGVISNGVECVHAYGGTINVNDSTIKNAWRPFVATQGGKISAYANKVSNFTDQCALSYGGEITLKNAIITMGGSGGKVQATQGGTMNITGTNFVGSKRVLIEVFYGGTITATESTLNGGKMTADELNILPNAFSDKGSGFILYNKL